MKAHHKNTEGKKRWWTEEEDKILMDYVKEHGRGQWNRVATMTGLERGGKSCRLRWVNYLSPNLKRGDFSEEEDDLIIRLHKLLGNRWSLIAGRLPGRTDNQVKNYWNTHLCKKLGIKKENTKLVGSSCEKEKGTQVEKDQKLLETDSTTCQLLHDKDLREAVVTTSTDTLLGGGTFNREVETVVGGEHYCIEQFWLSDDSFNIENMVYMEFLDDYNSELI